MSSVWGARQKDNGFQNLALSSWLARWQRCEEADSACDEKSQYNSSAECGVAAAKMWKAFAQQRALRDLPAMKLSTQKAPALIGKQAQICMPSMDTLGMSK